MNIKEALFKLDDFCNANKIEYIVTGTVALAMLGVPSNPQDIDIKVFHLKEEQEAKLKELGFNTELTPIVYLGGGASVMRMFGSMKGPNICYLEDVRANAIGYEYIASRKLFK